MSDISIDNNQIPLYEDIHKNQDDVFLFIDSELEKHKLDYIVKEHSKYCKKGFDIACLDLFITDPVVKVVLLHVKDENNYSKSYAKIAINAYKPLIIFSGEKSLASEMTSNLKEEFIHAKIDGYNSDECSRRLHRALRTKPPSIDPLFGHDELEIVLEVLTIIWGLSLKLEMNNEFNLIGSFKENEMLREGLFNICSSYICPDNPWGEGQLTIKGIDDEIDKCENNTQIFNSVIVKLRDSLLEWADKCDKI